MNLPSFDISFSRPEDADHLTTNVRKAPLQVVILVDLKVVAVTGFARTETDARNFVELCHRRQNNRTFPRRVVRSYVVRNNSIRPETVNRTCLKDGEDYSLGGPSARMYS